MENKHNPEIAQPGPEEKEITKNSPVYITYRDNDLYRNMVPKLMEEFSSIDRRTEAMVVPQAIEDKEVMRYIKDNVPEDVIKQIKQGEVLFDETTAKYFRNWDNKDSERNLDELSAEIMTPALMGSEYAETLEGEKSFQEKLAAIESLVKKLIDAHPEIQEVYISKMALTAHGFKPLETAQGSLLKHQIISSLGFSKEAIELRNQIEAYIEDESSTDEQLLGFYLKTLDFLDDSSSKRLAQAMVGYGEKIPENFEVRKSIKNLIEQLAEQGILKEVVSIDYGGFVAESKIEEITVRSLKKKLTELLGEGKIHTVADSEQIPVSDSVLTIKDRHERWDKLGKYRIILPISSAVHYIMENDLLKVDPHEIDEELKKVVSKYYSKDEVQD